MSKGGVKPIYKKPFDRQTITRVLTCRNKGMQPKEIAYELNLKQHAVYQILKDAGRPASGRGAKLVDRINARLDADCAERVRQYCARENKSITVALNDFIRAAPKEVMRA